MQKDGCCRKFTKFLFSHIGLCGMVVLYSVAGAFIFEHLEKANEVAVCDDSRREYEPFENKTLDNMLKVIQSDPTDMTSISLQLRGILQAFRDNTIVIGYDGTECSLMGEPGGPSNKWSWSGSLMFSVTVISTIGYGHIAPKTVWGRLVCIAYAVLGIPLMLLCLANIGEVLADIFRFIYSKICCCGCCKRKQKTKVVHIKPSIPEPDAWRTNEKSKIITSMPPQHTEFSKIPSKTPDSDRGSRDVKFRNESSRTPSPLPKPMKIVPLDIKTLTRSDLTNRSQVVRGEPMILDDDSDDDDDDFDEKKITVPLTVTMIVIAGYIFGGAMLFGLWEGWDNLQSAYFCFITLSTIGFGDVVPGTDYESEQARTQLVLGAIYILFGMAILSMCFSLMQDEIIAKCKWVGQKLGILDKSDD
ncbi:hypothetical protein ScPMuIL_018726 [Solemya velum]